jgi:signal peptidase II
VQERRVAPPLSAAWARRAVGARRIALAVVTAALVVAADQATKSWAVHRLQQGPVHVVWKLDLLLSYNTGSAFGLAQGWAPVLAAAAGLIVVALVAVLRGVQRWPMALALGLVLGGALGNLTDRVVRGHHGAVVDFVALHFWPTFNVADSCIVVGVLLAVALSWGDERGRSRRRPSG